MTERLEMKAVLEAVLFVAKEPVSIDKMVEVFDEGEREEAKEALQELITHYQEKPESGLMIDEVAGGLRLVTRPDLHGYLRRFFEVTGTNKLSMAALETLAIIAYRQPVTGPEIQELRGVNSSGVLKKLLERRMIRIAGRKEVVGKPFIYATTREFLVHFGLERLKELPPLEQFEELFGGDDEAEADAPADHEEQVLQEAAELAESEADTAAEAESAEIEAERTAAEEAEATAAILETLESGDGVEGAEAAIDESLGDEPPLPEEAEVVDSTVGTEAQGTDAASTIGEDTATAESTAEDSEAEDGEAEDIMAEDTEAEEAAEVNEQAPLAEVS